MPKLTVAQEVIEQKIYLIRGHKVMIDRDLASLYEVPTGRLNEQVKRNKRRFPDDFMFKLTKKEYENWISQIAISNSKKMGLRRMPYAFTEHGAAMPACRQAGFRVYLIVKRQFKSILLLYTLLPNYVRYYLLTKNLLIGLSNWSARQRSTIPKSRPFLMPYASL
jgi:hypothetical protein